MKILGLDIETGSPFNLPIEDATITEIGVVLWDTDCGGPVEMYSTLISDGPESVDEAIEYTGITNEMRKCHGVPLIEALGTITPTYNKADAIMAHNGENFDTPIVLNAFVNNNLSSNLLVKTWIDPLLDVVFPKQFTNHNLTYLKGATGKCYPGHRAIFDVCAMLEIALMYATPEMMLMSASSGTVTVRALVDYARKDLASKAKFRWNPESKMWLKTMRSINVVKDQYPFQTRVL